MARARFCFGSCDGRLGEVDQRDVAQQMEV